jgi:hypothetical protein
LSTKQYFPFTYRGRVYKKGPPFIRRVAAEILADKMRENSGPFTKGQWFNLDLESYELAEPRKMVPMIVGVVNYHLGHPHPPNAKIPLGVGDIPHKSVHPTSPEAAEIIQDVIQQMEEKFGGRDKIPHTVKQWSYDDPQSFKKASSYRLTSFVMQQIHGKGWRRGVAKQPSKGDRVKHFCKIVVKLRTPEGNRVRTMQEWRNAHAGSQRLATQEGIQWDVARILMFKGIPPGS